MTDADFDFEDSFMKALKDTGALDDPNPYQASLAQECVRAIGHMIAGYGNQGGINPTHIYSVVAVASIRASADVWFAARDNSGADIRDDEIFDTILDNIKERVLNDEP